MKLKAILKCVTGNASPLTLSHHNCFDQLLSCVLCRESIIMSEHQAAAAQPQVPAGTSAPSHRHHSGPSNPSGTRHNNPPPASGRQPGVSNSRMTGSSSTRPRSSTTGSSGGTAGGSSSRSGRGSGRRSNSGGGSALNRSSSNRPKVCRQDHF